MDTSQVETRRFTPHSKQDFMRRAKQIGQAITDHWDMHGRAPYLRDISEKVYGRETGQCSVVTRKMRDLGWVHHEDRHQHDYVLTGLGRAALFGQVQEPLHTDTQVREAPVQVTPRVDPASQWNPPSWETPIVHRRHAQPPVQTQPVWQQPTIPRPVAPPPPIAQHVNMTGTSTGDVLLRDVQDVDLVIELTSRGYKVSR